MKRAFFMGTIILVLASCAITPQKPKRQPTPTYFWQSPSIKRVAILDFQNFLNDSRLKQLFSNSLSSNLVRSGKWEIITRRQLESVLHEQALGLSGIIDPKTAARVGKIAGVDAVIFGTIYEPKYKYFLNIVDHMYLVANIKVVDSETGRILLDKEVKSASYERGPKFSYVPPPGYIQEENLLRKKGGEAIKSLALYAYRGLVRNY